LNNNAIALWISEFQALSLDIIVLSWKFRACEAGVLSSKAGVSSSKLEFYNLELGVLTFELES
jgi:hypothetical protein